MNDFYVILSNRYNGDVYKDNGPMAFKNELNTSLRFDHEGWKVALVQYESTVRKGAFVCSDVCTSTIIGADQRQILGFFPAGPSTVHTPHYLPVEGKVIDTISVFLISSTTLERLDEEGEGDTTLVLHFVYNP